jgi:hypothetical protein
MPSHTKSETTDHKPGEPLNTVDQNCVTLWTLTTTWIIVGELLLTFNTDFKEKYHYGQSLISPRPSVTGP